MIGKPYNKIYIKYEIHIIRNDEKRRRRAEGKKQEKKTRRIDEENAKHKCKKRKRCEGRAKDRGMLHSRWCLSTRSPNRHEPHGSAGWGRSIIIQ